jgi:YegS/Rv2252/BmrU family lipid kinase
MRKPLVQGCGLEMNTMQNSIGKHEAALVVNTQSRRGQKLYAPAKQELSRLGINLTEAYPVRDASRITAVVDEAISKGFRFIIVGGGDGTISSIMSSFATRDVCLGLLPMGTANNFARANGIPLDLKAAAEVIASGRIARVDLGQVDGKYFTNAVSIGLTSAIHRGSPDRIKRMLGRIGYLLIAGQRFVQHQAFRCDLRIDDRAIQVEALDVRIANGPFQGGMRILDEASVVSGDLIVRIIKGPTKWAIGRTWRNAILGKKDDPASVLVLRGHEIEISTTPAQYVSVDGEVLAQTPAQVSVIPGALQVIVPRPEQDV